MNVPAQMPCKTIEESFQKAPAQQIPFEKTYLSLLKLPLMGMTLPLVVLNDEAYTVEPQVKVSDLHIIVDGFEKQGNVFFKNFLHKMRGLNTLTKLAENTDLLKNRDAHALIFNTLHDSVTAEAEKESARSLRQLLDIRKMGETGPEHVQVEEAIFKSWMEKLEMIVEKKILFPLSSCRQKSLTILPKKKKLKISTQP